MASPGYRQPNLRSLQRSLLNGAVGLITGGHMQRTGRVLEFWGGWVTWYLKVFPVISGASAVTFGHAILARDRAALEASRKHEWVHVRQYERWGMLFIPAYLACWALLRARGKNPYFDNPFERQAFREAND